MIWNDQSWDIIDAHVHTFPDAVAEKAVGKLARLSQITPYTNGTLKDTREKLEACGIGRAVLLNIATSPRQQNSINHSAAEINQSSPQRWTALGSVHFQAEDALAQLEQIHAAHIPGIKLHPDYQGFRIDDPRLFPIYEKCAELGLVLVFHAGWDCYSPSLIHAPPRASRRVIDAFPSLKIVLAHFGGLKQWEEAERWLIGQNVWLDTALCASYADQKEINRLILRHPADRVLLGSDCPWENPARSAAWILEMDLPEDHKRAILSQNAQALYGITGQL